MPNPFIPVNPSAAPPDGTEILPIRQTDVDKQMTWAWMQLQVLKTAYPVGAVYVTTSASNPSTILGFGTWVSIATPPSLQCSMWKRTA